TNLEADIQKGTVRKVFVCPSDREGGRFGETVGGGGAGYNSYAFNEAALGWGTSLTNDGSGLTSKPYAHSRLRGNTAKFAHPGELFLFTDGAPRGGDGNGAWQVYYDHAADLTLYDFWATTRGSGTNPHA